MEGGQDTDILEILRALVSFLGNCLIKKPIGALGFYDLPGKFYRSSCCDHRKRELELSNRGDVESHQQESARGFSGKSFCK